MDTVFAAKIILTLVAFAMGVGPMRADFNSTHATNPLWPPHARFHVVWQVLTQAGVSLFVIVLLWGFGSPLHIWMAVALNYNWMITFVMTVSSMKMYDGALKDVNGIKPFKFNIGGKIREVDTNVFGATILAILNTVAVILLLS